MYPAEGVGGGEEAQKFPLLPALLVLVLLSLGAYFLIPVFSPPTPFASPTPQPTSEAGKFEGFSYLSETKYYAVGKAMLQVEHAAVISEKGKTEQYFFFNSGKEPVSFRTVVVAEGEFDESKGIWLADRILGIKFVVKNLTLNPQESAEFKYVTPSRDNVG